MKFIICITIFFLTYTSKTFCQSEFYFDEGSHLTLDQGSELTADNVIIYGTFSGGGKINGKPAYFLKLTAFLEGFYNSKCDCMISDTVRAYLRNIGSPFALVDSSIAMLNEYGVSSFNFNNARNATSYYLVLKHRNSIETWSSTGISFALNSSNYDFSTGSTQAFGNNMKLVNKAPERFAFYSGDVNQDGSVDNTDQGEIYNDGLTFSTGYLNTDLTGDGIVDNSDLLISYSNGINFIQVVKP